MLLRRARLAAAGSIAIAVDDHNVPGAQIVAVVALPGLAGRRAEISKITGGVLYAVLVVAKCGARARLVAAPGLLVTVGEVAVGPAGVNNISKVNTVPGILSSSFAVASAPLRSAQSAMPPAPTRTSTGHRWPRAAALDAATYFAWAFLRDGTCANAEITQGGAVED